MVFQGIAVLCENTNLASMAVGLRRFSDFLSYLSYLYSYRAGGKIKNLTIVNCNVEKLYGDIFRTNKITKLVIKDTPIRFYCRKVGHQTPIFEKHHLQGDKK